MAKATLNAQDALKERLDRLTRLMNNDDFLAGRGLRGEVSIRIFTYDPTLEMLVQDYLGHIDDDHIVIYNLYRLFLAVCDEMDLNDGCITIEKEDGGAFLLEQLNSAITEKNLVEKLPDALHQKGKVLLLYGVGDAYPFVRVHTLLAAIQHVFGNIPIVVLYPGEYSGNELILFNKFEPSNYYRAFGEV